MKPQYAGKRRDENEAPIVNVLEMLGAKVYRAHQPADLILGFRGLTELIEVENPDAKNVATRRKEHDERAKDWPGSPIVRIRDVGEAAALMRRLNRIADLRCPRGED